MGASEKIRFLCCINPKAGKDNSVLEAAEKNFPRKNIHQVIEESDIYITCDPTDSTVEALKSFQDSPDVIDTWIEVIQTRDTIKEDIKSDNVYLFFANIMHGEIEKFFKALNDEVDKVKSGDLELIYTGEIFSQRADVALLISSNIKNRISLMKRIRELPGVVDTKMYTLAQAVS